MKHYFFTFLFFLTFNCVVNAQPKGFIETATIDGVIYYRSPKPFYNDNWHIYAKNENIAEMMTLGVNYCTLSRGLGKNLYSRNAKSINLGPDTPALLQLHGALCRAYLEIKSTSSAMTITSPPQHVPELSIANEGDLFRATLLKNTYIRNEGYVGLLRSVEKSCQNRTTWIHELQDSSKDASSFFISRNAHTVSVLYSCENYQSELTNSFNKNGLDVLPGYFGMLQVVDQSSDDSTLDKPKFSAVAESFCRSVAMKSVEFSGNSYGNHPFYSRFHFFCVK